jgi:hypothetical protein
MRRKSYSNQPCVRLLACSINELMPLIRRNRFALWAFDFGGTVREIRLAYVDMLRVRYFAMSENLVTFGTRQNPARHQELLLLIRCANLHSVRPILL